MKLWCNKIKLFPEGIEPRPHWQFLRGIILSYTIQAGTIPRLNMPRLNLDPGTVFRLNLGNIPAIAGKTKLGQFPAIAGIRVGNIFPCYSC